MNPAGQWIIMLSNKLLLIPGRNKISLVNINTYKIIKVIEAPDSGFMFGTCMIKNDMVLTGGQFNLYQWKIEFDNLVLYSKKKNAHKSYINTLLNLGDGHIVSGSEDHTIAIW